VAHLNPTGRFSTRADDYSRYRPSYPPEIVPLLERECGLKSSSIVADAGSGTGLLSKLFLDFGCHVIGIEPNREMRQAGGEFLRPYQNFTGVDARAEETGLADASVDLVAAGQAFHWFDATAARQEFHRILRTPRWVVLIWNEREVTGGFLSGYEQLLDRYAPDYRRVDHRQIGPEKLREFFGHDNLKLATFGNVQEFDLPGVLGRLRSSSYSPHPGDAAYEPMMSELAGLFETHQENGRVAFLYRTNMYYGTL
jgi:SAM-dependent methyltransferase